MPTRRGIVLSSRMSYALAVLLLLLAAFLRLRDLTRLPPGLHQDEITDIRIAATARQGLIEVFYDLGGGEGRESLYHIVLAAVTSVTGQGLVSYQLFSIWVNLLALALVYALATRLFGPLAGVAALALLTVNLWMIVLGREIARESFLPLLVTGTLLALARIFSVYHRDVPRQPSTTPFVMLGLLLGLGFYVHPAHFMIVLASMIFILFMLVTRRAGSRRRLGYLGFALLLMMIVAMPYLISSLRLPDLSGAVRVFGDYNVIRNPPFKALGESLSGVLFAGDDNPARNVPGRPLIDLVSGVLVLIGVLVTAQNARRRRYILPLIFTLALAPVAFFTLHSPNFLALTGLLPLLALFFGLGVSTLYRSLPTTVARRGLAVGLVALFGFNLLWMGRDLYQTWPNLASVAEVYHTRLSRLAQHLDRTADTIPTLVCDAPSPAGRALSSTDLLLLMMNRKQAPLRYADCGTGLVLLNGGEGQQIIFPDPKMLSGVHPYLRRWIDQGTVLTRADLPPDSVVELDIERPLADKIGSFITSAPVSYAPEAPGRPGMAAPPIRFGGNITFLGYEREPTEAYAAGGILTVVTYWRVDGPVPPNLRLFTHVLPDPASIAAQTDTISVNVGALDNRDIFIQVTFVPLPASMPGGVYNVSIGAYDASNSIRMSVLDNEHERGTRLFVGQITVTSR